MMTDINGSAFLESTAVIVSSTRDGLSKLARAVCDTGSVSFAYDGASERDLLHGVDIDEGRGKLVVYLRNDRLLILGPKKHRDLFAQNFEHLLDQETVPSAHIENHDGHFYLSEDSLSVIIQKI